MDTTELNTAFTEALDKLAPYPDDTYCEDCHITPSHHCCKTTYYDNRDFYARQLTRLAKIVWSEYVEKELKELELSELGKTIGWNTDPDFDTEPTVSNETTDSSKKEETEKEFLERIGWV